MCDVCILNKKTLINLKHFVTSWCIKIWNFKAKKNIIQTRVVCASLFFLRSVCFFLIFFFCFLSFLCAKIDLWVDLHISYTKWWFQSFFWLLWCTFSFPYLNRIYNSIAVYLIRLLHGEHSLISYTQYMYDMMTPPCVEFYVPNLAGGIHFIAFHLI